MGLDTFWEAGVMNLEIPKGGEGYLTSFSQGVFWEVEPRGSMGK